MSASYECQPTWLDNQFWERLDRLESQHQRIQTEHEAVRRGLDGARRAEAAELQRAWQRYCQTIAELDLTTAEFERLRSRAG